MAKKGYSLDKGFLFLRSWERGLRMLSPTQFHRLFWDLYDFQESRGEKLVEYPDDPMLDLVSSLVVTQLQFRLAGAKRQKKGDADSEVDGEVDDADDDAVN